jgi:zinc transporter 9
MAALILDINTSLSLIIFLAIMVHKAPAAWADLSVVETRTDEKRGEGHLIIFSLAAPVGALATWAVVNALGGGSVGGEENTKWW